MFSLQTTMCLAVSSRTIETCGATLLMKRYDKNERLCLLVKAIVTDRILTVESPENLPQFEASNIEHHFVPRNEILVNNRP